MAAAEARAVVLEPVPVMAVVQVHLVRVPGRDRAVVPIHRVRALEPVMESTLRGPV